MIDGSWLERISLYSNCFLRKVGLVTKECLKSRGMLPVDKETLILVAMATRINAQSFRREVYA